jgi:HAD superfamily hydrolase (TIGR01490 family)
VPETPKQPKKEAAFFDLDNTLLRGPSSFLFGKAAFERKYLGRRDLYRFAWQQWKFILRGETAKMLTHIEDRALGLVAGHKAEELAQMVVDVYPDFIAPKLWPEAVRIAQEHMAKGREVWIITASPREMSEEIAKRLGLTGGLGTLVARDENGILTGELEGRPLHGKRKLTAIKKLAKERHISLKRSYAYSDSANDLPMLSHVGHPVAVNPDGRLTTFAKAAGWKILDFKKREIRRRNKAKKKADAARAQAQGRETPKAK